MKIECLLFEGNVRVIDVGSRRGGDELINKYLTGWNRILRDIGYPAHPIWYRDTMAVNGRRLFYFPLS